jgi:monooxygenase
MLKVLPTKVAYKLTRARNIGLQRFIYEASRKKPQVMRRLLLAAVRRQVGDKVDMKHFTPSYNPWDERLCAVPNGDLFKVLRQGKASIVTDHIDRFDATGITLKSGEHLDADIIVAATGLNIQMLGGATMSVDGKSVAINERMTYKGVLLQDVPNAAMIFGYTNSSWTLKADIANEYICRLLNTMDKKGYNTVVASDRDNNAVDTTIFGGSMRSGYIQRASTVLPRQGKKAPWQILNNYLADRVMLQKDKIEDAILKFGRGKKKRAA